MNISIYLIDSRGVFLGETSIDKYGPQPLGAVYEAPPDEIEGHTRVWKNDAWENIPTSSIEPVLPEVPDPVYPRFIGNHKLDLFTPEEQLAVVTATMSDPVVKLMYDRLLGAAYLSYEDPETEQGLVLLVDKRLLTAERKLEIVQQMQPL